MQYRGREVVQLGRYDGLAVMGPDQIYWPYPLTEEDKIRWDRLEMFLSTINDVRRLIEEAGSQENLKDTLNTYSKVVVENHRYHFDAIS